jgi:hypothetical protein
MHVCWIPTAKRRRMRMMMMLHVEQHDVASRWDGRRESVTDCCVRMSILIEMVYTKHV